jgi:hypothetical protein
MKAYLCCFAAALLLVVTGCSEPLVEGTVTIDGQPLPEGYIAFVPETSGQGGGSNIVNGKYTVHTVAGKYKVEITASKMLPLPPGQKGMDGATEEVRQYLPARYNTQTELTATVPAAAKVDFELKGQ